MKIRLIPASNEPSQFIDFVSVLARAFGECREGHNTKVSKGHLQLCCASSLMPRQLAAVYLTERGITDGVFGRKRG